MQNDISVESKHDLVVAAFQRARIFARSVYQNEVTKKLPWSIPSIKTELQDICFYSLRTEFSMSHRMAAGPSSFFSSLQ